MAGNLIMHEKGWLGHKETVLHLGEGPIWQIRWRGRLIAWANDLVRNGDGLCYSTLTSHRVLKYTIRFLKRASRLSTVRPIARARIFSNAPCIGKTIQLC
jgi:hypothetical protein